MYLNKSSHINPRTHNFFLFLFSHARSSRPIQSNAVTHPPTQPGFGCARGASTTHLPKHKTNRSTERHRSRVGVSCVAGSLNRFFRVSQGSVPRGSSWLGGPPPILLPHTSAPHFCPTLSKNEERLGDPRIHPSDDELEREADVERGEREVQREGGREAPPRQTTTAADERGLRDTEHRGSSCRP